MMNILEQEDIIKGLPDQALMQEAQMPSGQVPQYLVVSEIQRRSDMRKRYKSEQEQMPQGTVKDKVVQEGIMASMPPQMAMAPQMAQRMPNMPPPQMPQQGIEQAMPPQMMAEGGIVEMAPGGSMPGAGALYGMQKEYVDPLIERAKVLAEMGVASFEDALAQLRREAQINNPDYSMVGRGDLFPNMSELRQGLSDLGGQFQDAGQRGADAMRDAYAAIPQYSTGDPLQGVKDFAGNFAFDSAMNMPNYQMLGRNDLSLPSLPDQGFDPAKIPPGEGSSNIYAGADGFMGLGAIPKAIGNVSLSTAPQRGAGGRPFDLGGFSDVMPDLGMPTRDQRIAADRARVENIRSGLSDSVTSQDIDDAVAGMVTERAPRSGGFGGIADALGGMFDFDLPEFSIGTGRGTRRSLRDGDVVDVQRGDASVQGQSKVQTQGVETPFTDLPEYTDYTTVLGGDPVAVDTPPYKGPFSLEYLREQNAKSEALTDPDKSKGKSTPETKAVEALAKQPGNDRSNPANNPSLDFADLIADSRRQAMSNALIQLGAGIAGGDVSKGIAAAGQAATEGTQAARDLDMKRRLAEYEAGREDLRREEEARRYEEGMALKREQFETDVGYKAARLSADIEAAEGVDRRALLSGVNSLIQEANDELQLLATTGTDEQILEIQTYINTLKGQAERYMDEIARGLAERKSYEGFELVGQR